MYSIDVLTDMVITCLIERATTAHYEGALLSSLGRSVQFLWKLATKSKCEPPRGGECVI